MFLHVVFSLWCFSALLGFFCPSVFHLKLPSVAPITAYSLWLLILPFLHVILVVFFFTGSIKCYFQSFVVCFFVSDTFTLSFRVFGYGSFVSCLHVCEDHFLLCFCVVSSWCCVWLLWQDSKWVEEKQYLLRTNQELHEKVYPTK